MNKLITTLAAGAFASFSAQSMAEDFSEAVTGGGYIQFTQRNVVFEKYI